MILTMRNEGKDEDICLEPDEAIVTVNACERVVHIFTFEEEWVRTIPGELKGVRE